MNGRILSIFWKKKKKKKKKNSQPLPHPSQKGGHLKETVLMSPTRVPRHFNV